MKKIILKTVIVFSISIMGIFNFSLLVNNSRISVLKLNGLFTQATAACENPSDVYSHTNTKLIGTGQLPFSYSYVKSSHTNGYQGGPGCVCITFSSYQDCAFSTNPESFCQPSETSGKSCS